MMIIQQDNNLNHSSGNKRKGKTKLLQHNILDDQVKREFSIFRGISKVKALNG